MSNHEYVIAMRIALSDDDQYDQYFIKCFNMVHKILIHRDDKKWKQKINLLDWHNEKARRFKDFNSRNNFKRELVKIINELDYIDDLNFCEIFYEEVAIHKFAKESIVSITNKFVDLQEIFFDFCKEWIGKIKNKSMYKEIYNEDNFVLMQEGMKNTVSAEIYMEIDFQNKKIYFRCWGESSDIDLFIKSINEWWGRVIRERGSLQIFLSYSHKDEKWKDAIVTALAVLWQEGLIKIWQDRLIQGGEEWKLEIEDEIAKSHIILLLVSPDFIASEYCYKIETELAIERHNRRLSRVIPIYVRETLDSKASFYHLQGYPNDKKHLRSFGRAESDNKGIQQVARSITDIVDDIHKSGIIVKKIFF